MNNLVFTNIARFILLVFLQIFLLSKIRFFGTINPNIYLLFILLLPFRLQGWITLLIAFATGITIDIFSGTIGLHTSAALVTAFARPAIIKLVGDKADYTPTSQPTLSEMGFSWFISYAGILTLIHSFTLNYLDVFSFSEFFRTFFRSILSAVLTMTFILSLQYIFPGRNAKN
jgi:rod shape-determining protein MreD